MKCENAKILKIVSKLAINQTSKGILKVGF